MSLPYEFFRSQHFFLSFAKTLYYLTIPPLFFTLGSRMPILHFFFVFYSFASTSLTHSLSDSIFIIYKLHLFSVYVVHHIHQYCRFAYMRIAYPAIIQYMCIVYFNSCRFQYHLLMHNVMYDICIHIFYCYIIRLASFRKARRKKRKILKYRFGGAKTL